jgi:O-antigen ligase
MNSRADAWAGQVNCGDAAMAYDGRWRFITTALIWMLVVFMIVPEGFDYATVGSDIPMTGSALSRIVWLSLIGVGGLIVIWRVSIVWLLLAELNPFLLLFVFLAITSIAWSIEPRFTVRRMIRIGAIVLDGLAFAVVAWETRRFQNVLRPILTLMLAASVVFVAILPKLGIEQGTSVELAGAWHGLATQKNGFGSIAGITLLLWLHAGLTRESRRWWVLLGMVLAFLCLIESRSSTSLMATAFAAFFMLLLLRSPDALRPYMPFIVGSFAVALILYSLAMLQLIPGLSLVLGPMMALTGKDATFTGRTDIWQIITAHISKEPLLGSGYGAYWIGVDPRSPSYEMREKLYFYPTEAHNGYLDVTNDLGILGAVCLLLFLIVFLRQSVRLMTVDRGQAALYLSLFFEQMIANLSESRWFNVMCIEWVIMTLATVAVARGWLEVRFQAYFVVPRPSLYPAGEQPDRPLAPIRAQHDVIR